MKRTVYHITGNNKIHRSKKCAMSAVYCTNDDIQTIIIPPTEYSITDYVRNQLYTPRVCLRCWHCEEDKE